MQRRKYKKHKRPGSTGQKHYAYKHGRCTKLTRQEQADANTRLRLLKDLAIYGGFMSQPTKFNGRPPRDYIKPDFNNVWSWVYVLIKLNKFKM